MRGVFLFSITVGFFYPFSFFDVLHITDKLTTRDSKQSNKKFTAGCFYIDACRVMQ
jgi:hypothetical protein